LSGAFCNNDTVSSQTQHKPRKKNIGDYEHALATTLRHKQTNQKLSAGIALQRIRWGIIFISYASLWQRYEGYQTRWFNSGVSKLFLPYDHLNYFAAVRGPWLLRNVTFRHINACFVNILCFRYWQKCLRGPDLAGVP